MLFARVFRHLLLTVGLLFPAVVAVASPLPPKIEITSETVLQAPDKTDSKQRRILGIDEDVRVKAVFVPRHAEWHIKRQYLTKTDKVDADGNPIYGNPVDYAETPHVCDLDEKGHCSIRKLGQQKTRKPNDTYEK